MHYLLDLLLHFDKYLTYFIQHFGYWTYPIIFAVIFAETGLVFTPFLPGDSLLFVVGAFSAKGDFQPIIITAALIVAAVLGDNVNYAVGRYLGEKLINAKKIHLIKKEHLDRTYHFFEKYGGKTIILARFVPIVRTFAPFVAGFSAMDYPKFFLYNVVGGILWVTIFVMGGYFFGNIPLIKENLSVTIIIIVVVSVLPAIGGFIRARRPSKR